MKTAFSVLKETFQEWSDDKASQLAAALAYYTIFSLAPLLLIVIALVGLLMDKNTVQGEVYNQIRDAIGTGGADAIQSMVEGAQKRGTGVVATVIGFATLIWGAANVFNQLQNAMNTIWDVMPKPGKSIMDKIQDRVLTFSLIPAIGFLLLVSLIVDAALSLSGNYLQDQFPSVATIYTLQAITALISYGVVTLLFATIYKYLPDVKIGWKDVWIGSAVTALLFTIGRFLIALYIGRAGVASSYGAAGALIIVLLWVYYSAQILFLGAEFTQVYARRFGSEIQPEDNAMWIPSQQRLEQGLPADRNQRAKERTVEDREPRTTPSAKKRAVNYSVAAFLAFMAGAITAFFGKGGDSSDTEV
jgi:membrane protein